MATNEGDEGVHAWGPPQEGSDTDAGLFTKDDLYAALRLTEDPEAARKWLEAIWPSDAEQRGVFFWTDDTLTQVSLVSPELGERIRAHRRWTTEELFEKQQAFRRAWRL